MEDGSPIGYCIAILFFLLGGAYFAGTEIALASVNRIRIMSHADDGDKRAGNVLYVLDHFDKALTTLLIGNNIMHIACASVATLMATKLWGVGAVAATTFVTTFVVFLVAEMIPKRFAKAMNEGFALRAAGSLRVLMKLLAPVTALFSALSGFVSRPFRRKEQEEPTVTEDELYDIMETVAAEGALDEEKTELMQSALEFSDTAAREIFTPWERVVTIPLVAGEDQILSTIRAHVYSRLPVVDDSGLPVGVLLIRRYLKAHLSGEHPVLGEILEPVHYVDAGTPIDDLLPLMSRNRTHLSMVRDGEGRILGIVTVEDILEELVGEIYDEDDRGGAA